MGVTQVDRIDVIVVVFPGFATGQLVACQKRASASPSLDATLVRLLLIPAAKVELGHHRSDAWVRKPSS